MYPHADADVGVDTESGSWEAAKSRTLACPFVNASGAELSQQIAQEKGDNQDYYISHGWLTEVENGKFTPSIYKLYSLSLIYKCNYLKIMVFRDQYSGCTEGTAVGQPAVHVPDRV